MDELLFVASELRALGILNWRERLLLRLPWCGMIYHNH